MADIVLRCHLYKKKINTKAYKVKVVKTEGGVKENLNINKKEEEVKAFVSKSRVRFCSGQIKLHLNSSWQVSITDLSFQNSVFAQKQMIVKLWIRKVFS